MSKRSFFEQCALASGLLTPQQIDDARAGLGAPPPTAPSPAIRSLPSGWWRRAS